MNKNFKHFIIAFIMIFESMSTMLIFANDLISNEINVDTTVSSSNEEISKEGSLITETQETTDITTEEVSETTSEPDVPSTTDTVDTTTTDTTRHSRHYDNRYNSIRKANARDIRTRD